MSMEATERLLVKYSYTQGTETHSHLADLTFSNFYSVSEDYLYRTVLWSLHTKSPMNDDNFLCATVGPVHLAFTWPSELNCNNKITHTTNKCPNAPMNLICCFHLPLLL